MRGRGLQTAERAVGDRPAKRRLPLLTAISIEPFA